MKRVIISFEKSNVIINIDDKKSEYKKHKGLVNLTELMANPDKEISCLLLAADNMPKTWETERRMVRAKVVCAIEDNPIDSYHSFDSYDDNEIMDEKYINSLKKEAIKLIDKIAVAEENNDLGTVDRFKDELEEVTNYLLKMTKPNGKSRTFSDEFSKPIDSVRKSIMKAIKMIGEMDEELMILLRNQIRIGRYCCYHSHPSLDLRVISDLRSVKK